MKKFKLILLSICALIALSGCRGTQKVQDSMSYYNFDSAFVAASPSGALTIRSWGSGPDRSRAIEEAMKNAVSDVIFKGIKGATGYNSSALVNEVNARERYADYFDRFFADNGEYRKFVTESSSTDKSRVEAKSAGRQNYGVTVTIDRPALRRQLIDDGIISR